MDEALERVLKLTLAANANAEFHKIVTRSVSFEVAFFWCSNGKWDWLRANIGYGAAENVMHGACPTFRGR